MAGHLGVETPGDPATQSPRRRRTLGRRGLPKTELAQKTTAENDCKIQRARRNNANFLGENSKKLKHLLCIVLQAASGEQDRISTRVPSRSASRNKHTNHQQTQDEPCSLAPDGTGKCSKPQKSSADIHDLAMCTYTHSHMCPKQQQQQNNNTTQQQQQQQHSVAILAQDCHKIELFVCRPRLTVVNVSSSFRLSRNEVMTLQGSLSGSTSRLHLQSTPYLLLSWITLRQHLPFLILLHLSWSTLSQHQQFLILLHLSWGTLRQHQQFYACLHSTGAQLRDNRRSAKNVQNPIQPP